MSPICSHLAVALTCWWLMMLCTRHETGSWPCEPAGFSPARRLSPWGHLPSRLICQWSPGGPGNCPGGAACLRPSAGLCLVGRGRLPQSAGTPCLTQCWGSLRRGWTHLRDSVSSSDGAEVLSARTPGPQDALRADACQACPALQLALHLASLRQGRLFRLLTSAQGTLTSQSLPNSGASSRSVDSRALIP